jgi:hypothetical protein
MTCPGCGAPMRLEAGKDFLAGEYCGSMHFPDARYVMTIDEDERLKAQQEI